MEDFFENSGKNQSRTASLVLAAGASCDLSTISPPLFVCVCVSVFLSVCLSVGRSVYDLKSPRMELIIILLF